MAQLSCAIVGLPNVGKSTLFNALTRRQVDSQNYPFCTIEPNVGTVEVLDPRLQKLAVLSQSKQIVYATMTFIDIAGLVKGASQGEGLGNQFLSNIRECDAIVQVVRCFESEEIIHVEGSTQPLRDIETINLELGLADLQMAENIAKKLEKQVKGKKEFVSHLEAMQKAIAHLNHGKPLRSLVLPEEEALALQSYHFLTAKKVLYIANIMEKDLPGGDNAYVQEVKEFAHKERSLVIPLCAKFEEELSRLEEAEARDFLHAAGLKEPGLDILIRNGFHLLNLITYITTGEMETKAWTIVKGTTAAQAAGKIHKDFEKGFIRAEVVSYNDMITYKGRIGAREAGKARSEGRNYIVQDGDVILFYHNS